MNTLKLLLLLLIALWAACKPATQIESSWTEPSLAADSSKNLKKILFAAFLKDPATRKRAEDRLVEQYKGNGVASYRYLRDADLKTSNSMIADKLKNDGFDGIVVMRVLDKKMANVPGTYPSYYGNWMDYYSYNEPVYNNQSNYSVNKNYIIETNVYSLKTNKLVWNGVTSTVNFSDPDRIIDDVIKNVRAKMKSAGLITE